MYANDYNTMSISVSRKKTKSKEAVRETEFIIWKTAESRFKELIGDGDGFVKGNDVFILGEIYRRLRKLPEYDGSVAVLFAQSEYVICKRLGISQEEFDEVLHRFIENEIVNVVYSTLEYKVLSLDKTIFLTNHIYYRECGTDSKECADFSMKYEVNITEKK